MNKSYVLDTLLSTHYFLSPNFGGHQYSNDCTLLMKRVVGVR